METGDEFKDMTSPLDVEPKMPMAVFFSENFIC